MRALEHYYFIYGPPKCGKSTWASGLGNPLFLDTENGLRFIKSDKIRIRDWDESNQVLKELARDKKSKKFKNNVIVVDTADRWYEMCFNSVCEKNTWDHPADAAHGKGWTRIGREFIRAINDLQALDTGLVFISHSRVRKTTAIIDGYKQDIEKECSTLSPSPHSVITSLCDFIFCVGYEEKTVTKKADGKIIKVKESHPIFHTQQSADFDAGSRGGNLPPTIPLDAKWLIEHMKGIEL